MSLPCEYETTYIVAPDLDPSERAKVDERVKAIITEQFGGEIHRVDDWGRRELAYPIRKVSHGHYTYVRYLAPGECILELERILRILDPVIKFLTVRLEADEDTGITPDSGRSVVSNDDDDDDDDDE
ncbi:MAG: 30S ribosomal protein S6 [Phycisphaerales bacterium]|nr:30S ribosomal protein S6 [Phycisphaerales bacterium]